MHPTFLPFPNQPDKRGHVCFSPQLAAEAARAAVAACFQLAAVIFSSKPSLLEVMAAVSISLLCCCCCYTLQGLPDDQGSIFTLYLSEIKKILSRAYPTMLQRAR
jgi:hypothetical protein